MNGFWRRGLWVSLTAMVVMLLVWAVVAISGVNVGNLLTSSNNDDSIEEVAETPGEDVTLDEETKKDLTVTPDDLTPAVIQALCGGESRFNRNSIDGHGRRWSDSVSTPFKASAKDDMLKELFAENCTNPVLLDMNVQALSQVTIDGWNVGDHNPWMSEFLDKAGDTGLRLAFLTKKEGHGDQVFVTSEMTRTAALANTLLTRFKNVGVVKERSVANWHLPGGGLVANELIRTELNSKQEGLPVLRLEITQKDQGCVYAAGFNKFDKRFETLSCENTPTPVEECKHDCTTPPPGGCKHDCTSPPCTHDCGPLECEHDCGPPPECTHDCGPPECEDCPEPKDPSEDPAQNGNAPEGGGQNQDPGPGQPNPQPTFPSDPHTNPPPPPPPPPSTPPPTQPPEGGGGGGEDAPPGDAGGPP